MNSDWKSSSHSFRKDFVYRWHSHHHHLSSMERLLNELCWSFLLYVTMVETIFHHHHHLLLLLLLLFGLCRSFSFGFFFLSSICSIDCSSFAKIDGHHHHQRRRRRKETSVQFMSSLLHHLFPINTVHFHRQSQWSCKSQVIVSMIIFRHWIPWWWIRKRRSMIVKRWRFVIPCLVSINKRQSIVDDTDVYLRQQVFLLQSFFLLSWSLIVRIHNDYIRIFSSSMTNEIIQMAM